MPLDQQPTLVDAIAALAQAASAGTMPPNLVYIKIASPLGMAVVDPGAAAQDATTQQIMQSLGLGVTLGFGPAPAPQPGEANLFANLSTGAVLLAGGLAYALRPKLSTLVIVGGGLLLFKSGLLGQLVASVSSSDGAVL